MLVIRKEGTLNKSKKIIKASLNITVNLALYKILQLS